MIRKIMATVAMGGVVAALAAAPAFAHECYNTSRSAQGNASIAAHSPSYVTFAEIAHEFLTTDPDGPGVCEAGAQFLLGVLADNADAIGLPANAVISIRTVQAGGIGHNKETPAVKNLSDGKGIDHLEQNTAIDELLGANIGDAFALCV
jgi:hypothetical protein